MGRTTIACAQKESGGKDRVLEICDVGHMPYNPARQKQQM